MADLDVSKTQSSRHHRKSASAILAMRMALVQISIEFVQEQVPTRNWEGACHVLHTGRVETCVLTNDLNAVIT